MTREFPELVNAGSSPASVTIQRENPGCSGMGVTYHKGKSKTRGKPNPIVATVIIMAALPLNISAIRKRNAAPGPNRMSAGWNPAVESIFWTWQLSTS